MCGIAGNYNCPKAAEMIFLMLHFVQHRAQEYAGIVTSDGVNLFRHTGEGIIQDVFNQEILDILHGRNGIGQIRYSTVEDDPKTDRTQPLVAMDVAVAHNGNLINYQPLRRELEAKGEKFKTAIDTEVILKQICRSTAPTIEQRVHDAIKNVRGSYSLLILIGQTMIAIRDPYGNRPLWFGKRENSWFFCSEDVPFDNLDIERIREVKPGQMIIIDPSEYRQVYFDEQHLSDQPIPHRKAHCIFELIYFAHPGSVVDDEPVDDFRERCGRTLCQHCPTPGKNIIGVPDSSLCHAKGYADADPEAKIVEAIRRSHYIGRTFLEGLQVLRLDKIVKKFFVVARKLAGEAVTLVDDSIVRGNTMRGLIRRIRRCGTTEIHVRIAIPPIKYPCLYGIDTPTSDELLAANLSAEEIRQEIEVDSLEFMPLEGLRSLVKNPDDYCYACMTGEYPIN